MSDGVGSITRAADYDLWAAAERLRTVRQAHERFLALWAVDRLLDDPAAAARCWADAVTADGGDADDGGTPDNHAPGDGLKPSWVHRNRLDD